MVYKNIFGIPPCASYFSIKWIYLIEKRSFDQNYIFSNKNDMVCAMRNFRKKSCGISTYDKWNFKPHISSIFHFDWVSEGRMQGCTSVQVNPLSICTWFFQFSSLKYPSGFFFQVWTGFFTCKIQVWNIKLPKSKSPVRVVKNVIGNVH